MRARGGAFVAFATPEEAAAVVRALDGAWPFAAGRDDERHERRGLFVDFGEDRASERESLATQVCTETFSLFCLCPSRVLRPSHSQVH